MSGGGNPLNLDNDSQIALLLSTSYRIRKNADISPLVMQLYSEICDLPQILVEVNDVKDARHLIKR